MWPRTAQGVPPHTARHVCLGFAIRKHPIKTFVLIKINKRGPPPRDVLPFLCGPPQGGGEPRPSKEQPSRDPFCRAFSGIS